MVKPTLDKLISKYAVTDPLDEARKQISIILDGDIDKARSRYTKFGKRRN